MWCFCPFYDVGASCQALQILRLNVLTFEFPSLQRSVGKIFWNIQNIKKKSYLLPVPYGTKFVGVRENPFESAGEPGTKLHLRLAGCFIWIPSRKYLGYIWIYCRENKNFNGWLISSTHHKTLCLNNDPGFHVRGGRTEVGQKIHQKSKFGRKYFQNIEKATSSSSIIQQNFLSNNFQIKHRI